MEPRFVEVPARRYVVGVPVGTPLLVEKPKITWDGWPRAVAEQWVEVATPFRISRELVAGLDGAPIELTFDEARAHAASLGASLPRWYEWEIAVRGPEPWLWPWGQSLDRDTLRLRSDSYSVDDESVMGYYAMSETVTFIDSFGDYAACESSFGLTGLARAGREWNLCHDGLPTLEADRVLRSLSDLGAMAYMQPGVRPDTYGDRRPSPQLFSGPLPSCWGLERVKDHGRAEPIELWTRAAFRLVIR